MPDLPSGTVTFLFTDIEGSTRLWERDRTAMRTAVERHLHLLRGAIEAHSGVLYKTVGDGTQSAFPTPVSGLVAALDAQRALLAEPWPVPPGALPVRMALHAGEAEPEGDDYLAAPLNRLARLLGVASGGQVLLTEAVQQLVQDDLPPGGGLRDLGEIRLRDLGRLERIFLLVHPLLPNNVPALSVGQGAPRHFPPSLTPFLRRELEIDEVTSLLRSPHVHLVTLTGTGGIGKTRLAQEVGLRLAGAFADGAVFVDLAPLRDPALLLPEVASVLGLREAAGRPLSDVAQGYLAERQLLLVLDNFEHVLEAAPVVTTLLAYGSGIKILVTSRSPLRLRGEREYPVPTLRLPTHADAGDPALLEMNEAVAFFVDRAQAVRPDFALTQGNTAVVIEICRRLDGLPLALELAAGRVKILPPATLLSRLSARLPLLTRGTRDAPERQRTLRDAIAWSHELLSHEDCRLFRRLGSFVGGWTLEAAEAVVNFEDDLDVLEGLASLGDKSLIHLEESGTEPRYRMLEIIREFALEQLADSDDEIRVRDAHAHYFTDVVHEFDRGVFTAKRRDWQMRIEAEMPNLRASLSWLEQRADAEHLLLLTANAWHAFWERGNVREAREWLDRALALPGPATTAARARALAIAALSAWSQGDNDAAERFVLEALELAQREGLEFETGQAFHILMLINEERGEFARSVSFGEDAILHFRRAANTTWLPQALVDTGLNASLGGDVERAAAFREEGLALARAAGNTWTVAIALSDMGAEAEARGDMQTALAHYRESLALLTDAHDEVYIAHPLAGMASLAAATGQMDLAARLLGNVAFVHETRGTMEWSYERERDERTASVVRANLGEVGYNQAFKVGRHLSIAEAARQALDAVRGWKPEEA